MEGIGLDNMLGAAEVERLFSGEQETKEKAAEEVQEPEVKEQEETAEVDFSDLLGNQSESVGSERDTEGDGEAPESKNDTGAPNQNLFLFHCQGIKR